MRFALRGFAAVLLLCSAQAASAAVSIQYTLVPLGGNVYKYIYSVSNSGSGPAVQLFDILFDTALYQESSLQIVTPAPLNTQWNQQILHSVSTVLGGSYTALALSGGIPAGATVNGFSVQFTWLGSGTPGPQPFEIYDASTFTVLQTGTTAIPVTVPTASTLSLALLGIGLATASAFQMRSRAAEANRSRSPEAW